MIPSAVQTLEENYGIHAEDYGAGLDPMTGLPNQLHFRAATRRLLTGATSEYALLWLDVLNLRREYSIGGDHGVQRLITSVAASLRPWIERDELVCRYSDRSFLLFVKRDERTTERLKVIVDAASHMHLRGSEGKPEVAAGVSYFPSHASTAEELIHYASLAALAATRIRSRNPVAFQPEMHVALVNERNLEQDLRTALRSNQLSVVYQPQIDLITGDVIGVESLTRWTHPVRGPVSPEQFIPVAERSNLIDEIFAHSLRRLLLDAAEWRAAGIVLPSIAVNASAANIRKEDFVAIVARELADNPLVDSQLEIEVTESLLMDDEDLFLERLRALRAIGVNVSLDDFGTRYTGFNSLKGLPLNAMKIDRCFVHGVSDSSQSQSLCRTIVTMARHLKLSTIAEGVEDVAELRILKKIGCQAAQGYLFQRPVRSDEFLRFLGEWPDRKRRGEFAELFLETDGGDRLEADALLDAV